MCVVWVCACVYVHTCVKVHVCMWVSACGGLKLTSVIPPLGRVSWWTRKSLLANQLSSVNLLSPWAWYLQNGPPCVCKSEPAISSGKPNFYWVLGSKLWPSHLGGKDFVFWTVATVKVQWFRSLCAAEAVRIECDWFKHKWHSCVFILKCFTIISSFPLSSFVYTCACVCLHICVCA